MKNKEQKAVVSMWSYAVLPNTAVVAINAPLGAKITAAEVDKGSKVGMPKRILIDGKAPVNGQAFTLLIRDFSAYVSIPEAEVSALLTAVVNAGKADDWLAYAVEHTYGIRLNVKTAKPERLFTVVPAAK